MLARWVKPFDQWRAKRSSPAVNKERRFVERREFVDVSDNAEDKRITGVDVPTRVHEFKE